MTENITPAKKTSPNITPSLEDELYASLKNMLAILGGAHDEAVYGDRFIAADARATLKENARKAIGAYEAKNK